MCPFQELKTFIAPFCHFVHYLHIYKYDLSGAKLTSACVTRTVNGTGHRRGEIAKKLDAGRMSEKRPTLPKPPSLIASRTQTISSVSAVADAASPTS